MVHEHHIDAKELARLAGCGRSTVSHLGRKGRLPGALVLGGKKHQRRVWPRADAERLVHLIRSLVRGLTGGSGVGVGDKRVDRGQVLNRTQMARELRVGRLTLLRLVAEAQLPQPLVDRGRWRGWPRSQLPELRRLLAEYKAGKVRTEEEEEGLTIEDLAREARIGVRHVRRYVRQGRLPEQLGGSKRSRRWPTEALEQLKQQVKDLWVEDEPPVRVQQDETEEEPSAEEFPHLGPTPGPPPGAEPEDSVRTLCIEFDPAFMSVLARLLDLLERHWATLVALQEVPRL